MAYGLAASRYKELQIEWVSLSHKVGAAILPHSLFSSNIQLLGRLDMLVRGIEDEFAEIMQRDQPDETDVNLFHNLSTYSQLWLGVAYDVMAIVNAKFGKADGNQEVFNLFEDIRIIRVTLEKHQIADDWALKEPLRMQAKPMAGAPDKIYTYDRKDSSRSHIMGMGASARGSKFYEAIHLKTDATRWIERRSLSERMLAVFKSLPSSHDLERKELEQHNVPK